MFNNLMKKQKRTGFTVQSDDEYRNLKNIMRLYTAYNRKGDPDTLKKISGGLIRKDGKRDSAKRLSQYAVR